MSSSSLILDVRPGADEPSEGGDALEEQRDAKFFSFIKIMNKMKEYYISVFSKKEDDLPQIARLHGPNVSC